MRVELIFFASVGKHKKVAELLKCGVHVDAQNENQETALYFAAKNGREKTVRLLLKHNADPNIMNVHGFTPVTVASVNGHNSCLHILLKHGGTIGLISTEDRRAALERKKEHAWHDVAPKFTPSKPVSIDDITVDYSLDYINVENMFELANCRMFGESVTCKINSTKDGPKETSNELVCLRCLRHPHILYAINKTETTDQLRHILITEPIKTNLYNLLYYSNNTFDNWNSKRLLRQLASACSFLTDFKYVHNFINSSSVYIDARDDVKLGNFAYCKTLKENKCTKMTTEARKFHLSYIAPEVILQNEMSIESDIYSFGCVAWEVFSFTKPWSWLSTEDVIAMSAARHEIKLPLQSSWPGYIIEIVEGCTVYDKVSRLNFKEIHKIFDRHDLTDMSLNSNSCTFQCKQGLPSCSFAPTSKNRITEKDHSVRSMDAQNMRANLKGMGVSLSNIETTIFCDDTQGSPSLAEKQKTDTNCEKNGTKICNDGKNAEDSQRNGLKVTTNIVMKPCSSHEVKKMDTVKEVSEMTLKNELNAQAPLLHWRNRRVSSLKELEVLLCLMREKGESMHRIAQATHDYFTEREDNVFKTTQANVGKEGKKLDKTKREKIFSELFQTYECKKKQRKWGKLAVENIRSFLGNQVSTVGDQVSL